jgi:hypothetical protein
MKRHLALACAAVILAGCAAPAHPWAPQHQGIRAQAGSNEVAARKAAKLDPKLDQASYDAGVAVGTAKAAGKATTPKLKQGTVDKLSYDYGYTVGLIQGSINSFNRINGSFDVYQWKSFCYMNFEAMKEARATIQANPELAEKCPVALGVLEGGIQSFSSINGNFDVSQWKSFAYSNRKVLENALASLKAAAL